MSLPVGGGVARYGLVDALADFGQDVGVEQGVIHPSSAATAAPHRPSWRARRLGRAIRRNRGVLRSSLRIGDRSGVLAEVFECVTDDVILAQITTGVHLVVDEPLQVFG
jgi:hypothetical protein